MQFSEAHSLLQLLVTLLRRVLALRAGRASATENTGKRDMKK